MPSGDHEDEIIERIATRVGNTRSLRSYVRGKLRHDPAFAAALAILRKNPQPVLDLGCGLGLLGFYLREHGYREDVCGVDVSGPKITRAIEVARTHYDGGLTFRVASMDEVSRQPGATVLLDVLHYLSPSARAEFLDHVASSTGPGEVVIIRNAPRDGSWRFYVTYLEELWVRASGWIRSRSPIHFPTIDEVAAPFRARGFREEIQPLWGRTPFNSHLFVFSRATVPELSTGARLT